MMNVFNANNYGYNPYGTYIPQRPIQQPIQQEQSPVMSGNRPVLSGKQVDSIDVARATDIPLDGSISYFPLADGSAIITKQLGFDGLPKIVTFKPTIEEKPSKPEYLVKDDLDELRNEIDSLKKEIDSLKGDKNE